MSDPSLKDVLDAMARIQGTIDELRAETKGTIDELRAETKSENTQTRNEMHAFRAEMKDRVDTTFRRTIQPEILRIQQAIAEDVPTKSEMHALRSEMNARFDRVDKELKDLDVELTGHARVLHRKIEKDIEYLKNRVPRTAARAPRRRT